MRVSLLCFFFLAFGIEVFSQTSVGFRGGYATSSFSYRPAANLRDRGVEGVGNPTFAFVIEHFNAKNAGVELNVQWITLGFRQLNEDPVNPLQNVTELDYLKLPFLASFYAGRSGRFQIKLGPHIGYLLKARDLQREFTNSSVPEIPTYGGEGDNPRKFMYGINAGAGISKVFGKSSLAAEIRFAYDFTNPESQDRIFDMNSTTLEFGLSYLFQVREGRK